MSWKTLVQCSIGAERFGNFLGKGEVCGSRNDVFPQLVGILASFCARHRPSHLPDGLIELSMELIMQEFHYDCDILCCWQPTWDSLQSLSCVCTLVTNEWPDLNDHFGKSEHSYGHWLNLNIQVGYYQLWQLLGDLPAAADPKLRDITPLRLMSWLSYQLSPRTHLLIKECMSEFARIEPVQSDKIFQIGRFHLAGVGQAWKTWDDIRDAVIDEVTIHGKAQQPAVIVRLIRGFLPCPDYFTFWILSFRRWCQCVPLPRLRASSFRVAS